jgi:hypothetical protein
LKSDFSKNSWNFFGLKKQRKNSRFYHFFPSKRLWSGDISWPFVPHALDRLPFKAPADVSTGVARGFLPLLMTGKIASLASGPPAIYATRQLQRAIPLARRTGEWPTR